MRIWFSNFLQNDRLTKLIFGLIVLVCVIATFVYSLSEKAFYVWDNSFYQSQTYDFLNQLRISPSAGIQYILTNSQGDYNVYYSVPLLLFILGGNSRGAFESGLVLVYLVPFVLVSAFIGAKLIGNLSRRAFWVTLIIGFCLPTVWLPVLRGYPDTAAALVLGLAILLYLKDPTLKKIGQLLGLGLLLGLAILLRRHFAYSVISFFGALGVVALVTFIQQARQKLKPALRQLGERIIQLAVIGIVGLLLIILVNVQLVLKTLTIDYNKLYASYIEPTPKVLGWFLDSFGWVPFGASLVGLYLIWRKSECKPDVLFFGLFGFFELILWVAYVREISIQYTLHLTVFVIVGLAGLFLYIWDYLKSLSRPRPAQVVPVVGVLVLVLNGVVGLFLPISTFPGTLFTGNWQPLQRPDYQRVVALAEYLDQQTAWEDQIYTVASSYRFNAETLLAANEAGNGTSEPTIQLLTPPDIDSRDYYPLEPLLEASLVVVIDPYQYHVSYDQQLIVRVVYDMFKQNTGLARDFTILNPNFMIDSQTSTLR